MDKKQEEGAAAVSATPIVGRIPRNNNSNRPSSNKINTTGSTRTASAGTTRSSNRGSLLHDDNDDDDQEDPNKMEDSFSILQTLKDHHSQSDTGRRDGKGNQDASDGSRRRSSSNRNENVPIATAYEAKRVRNHWDANSDSSSANSQELIMPTIVVLSAPVASQSMQRGYGDESPTTTTAVLSATRPQRIDRTRSVESYTTCISHDEEEEEGEDLEEDDKVVVVAAENVQPVPVKEEERNDANSSPQNPPNLSADDKTMDTSKQQPSERYLNEQLCCLYCPIYGKYCDYTATTCCCYSCLLCCGRDGEGGGCCQCCQDCCDQGGGEGACNICCHSGCALLMALGGYLTNTCETCGTCYESACITCGDCCGTCCCCQ